MGCLGEAGGERDGEQRRQKAECGVSHGGLQRLVVLLGIGLRRDRAQDLHIELVELAGKVLSRDLVFTFEKYKEYENRRFELRADLPVYYTLARGLLIASSGRENIIRCIDQFDAPEGALASASNYQKLRPEKSGRVNTLVYGNIEGFCDILKVRFKENAEFQQKAALFNGLKQGGIDVREVRSPFPWTMVAATVRRPG